MKLLLLIATFFSFCSKICEHYAIYLMTVSTLAKLRPFIEGFSFLFLFFFFVFPEEIILPKQFFLSLPKRRSYLCIGISFGGQTAGYIVQITSGLILGSDITSCRMQNCVSALDV